MCVLSKCETNKPKLLCLNLQKATNSALVYNVILCMFLKLAIWIKDGAVILNSCVRNEIQCKTGVPGLC